jgi:hypothetical protein
MQHLTISVLTWVLMLFAHPFFISLTEIRFNPESKRLEMSQKIFWDDLEVGLANHFKEKIDFLNPKDKEKLDQQISEYLIKHTQVSINGKLATFRVLGYEVEEDAAWFYLESSPVEMPKTFEITNTVLLEDRAGQQNIVHVYQNSKSPRSLLLSKGEEKGKIEF